MSLRELASCPAATCTTTTGIEDAARRMVEANVGFLCVVDDDERPVGVLTDRDIVVRAVARHRAHDARVGDVMTRHAASVSEDGTVAEAAQVMADHMCRRLVVVGHDKRAVGVISLDDLLRVAGDELAHVARAVRGGRVAHDVIP